MFVSFNLSGTIISEIIATDRAKNHSITAQIDDEPIASSKLGYFISNCYGMNYLHRFVKLKYFLSQFKNNGKAGTLAGCRIDRDAAAVFVDDFFNHRQAQPGARAAFG